MDTYSGARGLKAHLYQVQGKRSDTQGKRATNNTP